LDVGLWHIAAVPTGAGDGRLRLHGGSRLAFDQRRADLHYTADTESRNSGRYNGLDC